jgi:Ca-activated chloride channel family protein
MHVTAHLDVDLVAVETTDTVTVMLDLQAPAAVEDPTAARPEHTAIVVLDRSGSMSGHRLEAAKRALADLVTRLDDRDTFGLITFDDATQVVVPAGRVADHGRDRLARLIAAIEPGGMTDLSGGYLRGLQEARRGAGPAGATIVLLSDGHANAGITDPVALRQVAANAGAQAITTSTIGIGHGYDQDLLAEIATGGNGNHSFAADADSAAAAVLSEVEGLLSKTAQAASLLIAPSSEVTRIGILNDLPSHAVASGIMVELGDFYSGETRRLLIELHIPAMAGLGLAQVAELTLTYVELPAMEQHTVTLPVSVNVVPADVAAQRVPAPEVHREKLLLSAQQAKRASEDALARGDYDTARTTLDGAAAALAAMPEPALNDEVAAEIAWLHQTRDGLTDWDTGYTSKRLRAEANRKSRGYKNREQGGERP